MQVEAAAVGVDGGVLGNVGVVDHAVLAVGNKGMVPCAIRRGSTSSVAPTMNSALSMLLRAALALAFSIAGSTISMPMTFFAFLASIREIVPAPQ